MVAKVITNHMNLNWKQTQTHFSLQKLCYEVYYNNNRQSQTTYKVTFSVNLALTAEKVS